MLIESKGIYNFNCPECVWFLVIQPKYINGYFAWNSEKNKIKSYFIYIFPSDFTKIKKIV